MQNVEQFVRDSHRSAGLSAVDEEHETVARVVKLDERRLVAIRQARRCGGVHSVDAPEELPLFLRQPDPFAAVLGDVTLRDAGVDAARRIFLISDRQGQPEARRHRKSECDDQGFHKWLLIQIQFSPYLIFIEQARTTLLTAW